MHDEADRFPTVCKLFGCGSVVKKNICIIIYSGSSLLAGGVVHMLEIIMDDSPSNQYHSSGPNNEAILNQATNLDSEESAGIVVVHRPDLEGADSREKRERGRGRGVGRFTIVADGQETGEEGDDSVSSASSEEDEEVDEHRLLSASFHAKAAAVGVGGGDGIASAQSGGSNLSNSWNDDDLDPFSYVPPLTKWDYFKVGMT